MKSYNLYTESNLFDYPYTLSHVDIERASMVLSGKMDFIAGSEFLHFRTQTDTDKASTLLKEWTMSKLTAEEFADWQSNENKYMSVKEFIAFRRGHFKGKNFGI